MLRYNLKILFPNGFWNFNNSSLTVNMVTKNNYAKSYNIPLIQPPSTAKETPVM